MVVKNNWPACFYSLTDKNVPFYNRNLHISIKWKFRFRGQWWEGQLIYFNFEDSKFESRFFWKERGSNDSLKEQGIFEISKYFIKIIYLQICTLNHVGKNKQIYLQKYRLFYRKVFQIHCIRSVAKNGVSWNFKLRRWQYF